MPSHTARRPDGQETLFDPDGRITQFDTQQCPHCGGHFRIVPGSGTRRTFCTRCARVTCGNPMCDACIPIEAQIEHWQGENNRYTDLIKEVFGV